MLILDAVQLLFFTVALVGMYFKFVLNAGLIIQRCVIAKQGLHRSKAFSASRISMLAWEVERRQPGQVTPTDQRDIPDNVISC